MVVAVWSVKGGVGVSSVAALLAIGQVERAENVLLVDLCGDQPALLGLDEPMVGPGIAEWCAMSHPHSEALARLEIEARPGLRVLHRGTGPLTGDATELLAVVESSERKVIVDCGMVRSSSGTAAAIVQGATQSLLVTRECYLALRAVRECQLEPDGVIVLKEPRRVLGRADVESVANAPVVAEVALDSGIARAIDSGLLAARLPRALLKAVGKVVVEHAAQT